MASSVAGQSEGEKAALTHCWSSDWPGDAGQKWGKYQQKCWYLTVQCWTELQSAPTEETWSTALQNSSLRVFKVAKLGWLKKNKKLKIKKLKSIKKSECRHGGHLFDHRLAALVYWSNFTFLTLLFGIFLLPVLSSFLLVVAILQFPRDSPELWCPSSATTLFGWRRKESRKGSTDR